MGNCPSTLDCNAEEFQTDFPEPLEVDPDIAGPGVLASFIISGSMAIFVIFVGYFTDSLPRRHLHKLDRVFIRQTREAWIFSCVPMLGAGLRRFKRVAKKSRLMRLHFAHVPREIRVEALLRFLLVNSDQQLVTGLAVLVGGLARRCTISSYEFQIVMSLGWFSTTTHLATLTVLTNYFRDHPEVLGLRLIGMLSTLIILSFSIVVALLRDSLVRAPLQCAIYDLKKGGGQIAVVFVLLLFLVGAFISRIVSLSVDARKSKENKKKLKANLRALTQQTSHDTEGSRSKSLLPYPDEKVEISHHDQHEESGFINSYAKIILWIVAHTTKALPKGEDFQRLLPLAIVSVEEQRDAHFNSAITNQSNRSWMFYADLLSVDYCNSFAFGFSILVFAFAFGIAQTVQSRETKGIPLTGEARAWGFGQIVPLFLLALPLLAAAEIYFESRRKAHSHFYALAIADGGEDEANGAEDATAENGQLSGLQRTDTITPHTYRTFADTHSVKYGLRITIVLSTMMLGYAGAAMEASFAGAGYAAVTIIGIVVLFAIYATWREVFLVGRRLKEVAHAERRTANIPTSTEEAPKQV